MSDTTIGEILVSMGVLTEKQRSTAMDYQRLHTKSQTFGEVLVQLGYCTLEEIDVALGFQKKLRSEKPQERAVATYDVAKLSKEKVGEARRQLIATGRAIIEKAGTSDIPTPVLGVPIIGG
jgi:hypothetical protein